MKTFNPESYFNKCGYKYKKQGQQVITQDNLKKMVKAIAEPVVSERHVNQNKPRFNEKLDPVEIKSVLQSTASSQ